MWQHAASENPQGSTQTMVNGQHFSGTGYQLDGTENRDPILGIIVINPNARVDRETKITSQNYDAEFGQATAGVVSVQTKSGTNECSRQRASSSTRATGSRRAIRSRSSQPRSADRQVPAGDEDRISSAARWAAPIVAEPAVLLRRLPGHAQHRRRLAAADRADAPRRRNGDLSAYGVNIYDPASGRAGAAAAVCRQRDSQRPASRRRRRRCSALIPLPNAAGRDNGTRDNYVASGSEAFDDELVQRAHRRPRSAAT